MLFRKQKYELTYFELRSYRKLSVRSTELHLNGFYLRLCSVIFIYAQNYNNSDYGLWVLQPSDRNHRPFKVISIIKLRFVQLHIINWKNLFSGTRHGGGGGP